VERVAVLRFENLTGDASLDWMGRALSTVLAYSISGDRRIYAIPLSALRSFNGLLGPRPAEAPGISAERTQALQRDAVLTGR